jgi:hypothetical protein
MKKQKTQPLWLSTSAVARLMGQPERSVRRWLAQAHQANEYGVQRSEGGFYRIPQTEVDRLLSQSETASF